MKVYYIAVSSWDGSRAYTFDYILPFLTKQGRNDAIKRIEETPSFKKGDITFHIGQEDIQDLQKEAVEWDYTLEDGRIEIEGDPLPCLNPILNLPYPKFKPGDKVKLIIVKED